LRGYFKSPSYTSAAAEGEMEKMEAKPGKLIKCQLQSLLIREKGRDEVKPEVEKKE